MFGCFRGFDLFCWECWKRECLVPVLTGPVLMVQEFLGRYGLLSRLWNVPMGTPGLQQCNMDLVKCRLVRPARPKVALASIGQHLEPRVPHRHVFGTEGTLVLAPTRRERKATRGAKRSHSEMLGM